LSAAAPIFLKSWVSSGEQLISMHCKCSALLIYISERGASNCAVVMLWPQLK
jgi:hypothetical protein